MTTKIENTYKIAICYDCLAYLANGEVQDGEGNDITAEIGERIEHYWSDGVPEITLGGYCDDAPWCTPEREEFYGEPHHWFSWQPCEGCGSPLGGDRWHATVWYDTEREA